MGAFLGVLLGTGLFLVYDACTSSPRTRREALRASTSELLTQAGLDGVAPSRLVAVSAGLGGFAFLLVAGLSHVALIGLVFGGFAAATPLNVLRARRRRRTRDLRDVWPEVVDNLASAIRAGLALPEAVPALRDPRPVL